MNKNSLALSLILAVLPAALPAQGLDPALLLKPPVDSWPTHHGDYSGRRYSTLKNIDTANVKGLSLAWVYRANLSPALATVGGEGPENAPAGGMGFGGPQIKSTPLLVNGVLYFTVPDHVWAVDARRPRAVALLLRTRAASIGNCGVGMYRDWLYFTPDNYFVSLEARQGVGTRDQRGRVLLDAAPVVVRNHASSAGRRFPTPGYLESRDPERATSVALVHDATRREPGLRRAGRVLSAHGGGCLAARDPRPSSTLLRGHRQPEPRARGPEPPRRQPLDLLDRGHRRTPASRPGTSRRHRDTHDWDSAQVPILIDGTIDLEAARCSRRPTATATSSSSTRERQVRPDDDHHRDAELTKGGQERQPIPDPDKDASIRHPDLPDHGRRHQLAPPASTPTPASSTSGPRRLSASLPD